MTKLKKLSPEQWQKIGKRYGLTKEEIIISCTNVFLEHIYGHVLREGLDEFTIDGRNPIDGTVVQATITFKKPDKTH